MHGFSLKIVTRFSQHYGEKTLNFPKHSFVMEKTLAKAVNEKEKV
jgi:hypothetical protein